MTFRNHHCILKYEPPTDTKNITDFTWMGRTGGSSYLLSPWGRHVWGWSAGEVVRTGATAGGRRASYPGRVKTAGDSPIQSQSHRHFHYALGVNDHGIVMTIQTCQFMFDKTIITQSTWFLSPLDLHHLLCDYPADLARPCPCATGDARYGLKGPLPGSCNQQTQKFSHISENKTIT